MKKARKLISYSNLPQNAVDVMLSHYKDEMLEHLISIDVGKKKPIYALRVEMDDVVFLVKVDPKKIENKGKAKIDFRPKNEE